MAAQLVDLMVAEPVNQSQSTFAAGTTLPDDTRIAFVLPSLREGGAEQVVRLLAREMSRRHRVLVVAAFAGGGMESILREEGVPLAVLGNKRRIRRPVEWLSSLVQSVLQLRDVFAEFGPDVINVHLLGPEVDAQWAAHLAGIKSLIITLHNTYPAFCSKHAGDRVRLWKLKRSYKGYSAAIAVSDEVRDWALRHGIVHPERVHVVRNGIDLSQVVDRKRCASLRGEKGMPLDKLIFITVAALRSKKGHSVLLEAIAHMPHEPRNECLFLLVGEGPERQWLEAQAMELGIGEHVRFLGLRQDVPELLALSDVYVVPSHYEGLSLALMEAMATGLPVVSTRVAGSTSLVRNGVNGFLVPIGDAAALSGRLTYCLQHADGMGALGAWAQRTMTEGFSSVAMARQTESVFATVMRTH